jgi:hypothetical protein
MTEHPSAHQVIRAAIAAAGGATAAGEKLGRPSNTVSAWAARGSMPAVSIKPLCDAGGNVVAPLQILEALARDARAAA